jgi:hypothetical protein
MTHAKARRRKGFDSCLLCVFAPLRESSIRTSASLRETSIQTTKATDHVSVAFGVVSVVSR